jgi:hypothetical protein
MSSAAIHSTDTLTVYFCAGTSNNINKVHEESFIVSYNKSGHNDILLLFGFSVLRYILDAQIFLQPQPISLTKTHHISVTNYPYLASAPTFQRSQRLSDHNVTIGGRV